jgi:hypothetical protein
MPTKTVENIIKCNLDKIVPSPLEVKFQQIHVSDVKNRQGIQVVPPIHGRSHYFIEGFFYMPEITGGVGSIKEVFASPEEKKVSYALKTLFSTKEDSELAEMAKMEVKSHNLLGRFAAWGKIGLAV